MKCIAEGRPLTREVRRYTKSEYPNPAARDDLGIRTFKEDALTFSNEGSALIDIRLPGGFSAEITHMPEYPQEGVLRGGHIPGAKNVPWKTAVNEDGIFKSADELRRIYTEGLGLNPSEEMGWSKRRSVAIIRHALGETILIQKV
jgi:thiosulfate/3-mercaptopyruvate sulfurtransferase